MNFRRQQALRIRHIWFKWFIYYFYLRRGNRGGTERPVRWNSAVPAIWASSWCAQDGTSSLPPLRQRFSSWSSTSRHLEVSAILQTCCPGPADRRESVENRSVRRAQLLRGSHPEISLNPDILKHLKTWSVDIVAVEYVILSITHFCWKMREINVWYLIHMY